MIENCYDSRIGVFILQVKVLFGFQPHRELNWNDKHNYENTQESIRAKSKHENDPSYEKQKRHVEDHQSEICHHFKRVKIIGNKVEELANTRLLHLEIG